MNPRMLAEIVLADTVPAEEWAIWWLSFATDDGFLGCVVLRAANFGHAIHRTHQLKVNPGGSVLTCGPMPRWTEAYVPDSYQCRLLNREECVALDRLIELRLKGEA